MAAKYFLYWLKGYLNALDVEGADLNKDHVNRVQTMLEMAIKAEVDHQKLDPQQPKEEYKFFTGSL